MHFRVHLRAPWGAPLGMQGDPPPTLRQLSSAGCGSTSAICRTNSTACMGVVGCGGGEKGHG